MNIFRARVQALRFCCGLAVLTTSVIGFGGCRNGTPDVPEDPAVQVASPMNAAPIDTAGKITKPVFDVPSLIGKNIDQVTALLGPSTRTEQEKQADAQEASQDENYSKPEADLMVSYQTKDKLVTQLSVIVHGPNGDNVTGDASQLMLAGNLTTNDVRYKTELVTSALDPKQYTGIKVTPYFLPTPIPTPRPKTKEEIIEEVRQQERPFKEGAVGKLYDPAEDARMQRELGNGTADGRNPFQPGDRNFQAPR